MAYMSSADRLSDIRGKLDVNEPVEPMTVRQLIGWFGAERRGYKVAWRIRRALERAKLRTVPDFDGVHIDARIRFERGEPATPIVAAVPRDAQQQAQPTPPQIDAVAEMIVGASADPAFRIGRLESANTKPLSVHPDCTLGEAATLMLRHDFSQIPVMPTERDVKGIISWETIGAHLAFNSKPVATVRECMKSHYEVQATDSLFRVIAHIVEHSYVLVRGEDRTITGIVTTSDLSLQF